MKPTWIALLLLLLTACQATPPINSTLNFQTLSQQSQIHAADQASPRQLSIRRIRQTAPALFGVNYYPQTTPWEAFWQQYQPEVIQQDLLKAKQLGFNSLRIFVFYQQFGGSQVNTQQIQKLRHFLDQAQQHDLKVVVTLFDQFSDYTDLESSRQHIQGLVQSLSDHPAIAAWDLKNESDRDYPHYGQQVVRDWMRQMSQFLQSQVQQPVTASYAAAAQMGSEVEGLDYLTFHYYDYESKFNQTVSDLKQRFPGHELVLGEFGFHTWESKVGDPHLSAHQFNYFNAILAAARENNLAGVMVWSLYDHSPDLKQIKILTQESHNNYMGLLDLKQEAKAGVKALQQVVQAVDAQSGASLSLESTQIKLVLKAAVSSQLTLSFKSKTGQQQVAQYTLKAGVNSLHLQVSSAQMKKLIHLEDQLLIDAIQLLDHANQSHSLKQVALILRQR